MKEHVHMHNRSMMVWILVLLGSLAVSVTPTIVEETNEDVDCSTWSIEGVRLGMTLAEVKASHKKLKRGVNYLRPDDRGKKWYWWAESRMKRTYRYVLPESDDPSASIISVVVLLDVSETTPAAVIDALIERWGDPVVREAPVSTVRYSTAFGAPKGEFEWTATTWEDTECDVLVTLLDTTKMSPVAGIPPFKEVTLSLDSISKMVEEQERELEKARDIVKP